MQIAKSFLVLAVIVFFSLAILVYYFQSQQEATSLVSQDHVKNLYWFVLHRKSNTEELYKGVPGDKKGSELIKTFVVKTGVPGQSPTPLPNLVGKKYWLITDKEDSFDNPETAPYFLTLNIDAPEDFPYGPMPYEECDGMQCDWGKPGYFGLHGVAGDPSRLSPEDLGSSGCIRHTDEDISYLYNLLDPEKEEIRYYVEDN